MATMNSFASEENNGMLSAIAAVVAAGIEKGNSFAVETRGPVVAEPPKGNPKGSKDVFGGGGRKLIASTKDSKVTKNKIPGEDQPVRQKRVNTNMDDLDRLLEKDAIELLNMKKDISAAQKAEIDRALKSLNDKKKEYDVIINYNELKEKEIKGYNDKLISLNNVSQAVSETGNEVKGIVQQLNEQIEEVNEEIAAESRTHKMITYIMNRLNEEINSCRVEAGKLTFTIEHVNHELNGVESTLRLSKHELSEQERTLNQLQSTLKSRKAHRQEKMVVLHNIVTSGEQSIAKIQYSMNESMMASKISKQNTMVSENTRSNIVSSSINNSRSIQQKINSLSETMSNVEIGDKKKTYTNDQIKEMIERYKTRHIRIEKLDTLAKELRDQIQLQKNKKEDLTQQLHVTAAKYQQLASSRQLYQEVDMKDTALANARKEFDECKEKEYKLRNNIESVKRAFPRFLTKITKTPHPVPSDDQLPDIVHKLEDEISKLIKAIDTAMLKDATADDLQAISAQSSANASSNDSTSEVGRLQKLPGFARLQKQLFYNLMSARPDSSNNNIRVNAFQEKKHNDQELGQYSLVQSLKKGTMSSMSIGDKDKDKDQKDANGNVILSLDRETIKNISKLVVERDKHKGPKNPMYAEKKAPKKEFKFKFISIT
jgi:chromosome segregation ATPase